jgi:hypothetical protein
MSTSDDGTIFTPWTQISAILTRYIKFKISFTNTSAVTDIVINLTGKSKELAFADLNTETLTYNNGIILPETGFLFM